MNPLNFLSGYKTYIAAAGLVGQAVYQFSQNDTASALHSFLQGLGLFGMRSAISGIPPK